MTSFCGEAELFDGSNNFSRTMGRQLVAAPASDCAHR